VRQLARGQITINDARRRQGLDPAAMCTSTVASGKVTPMETGTMPVIPPVEKYPRKFSIYIRSQDIANGEPGCSGKCPAALALKRKFPDVPVGMGRRWAVVGHRLAAVKYCIPPSLTKFTYDFDMGMTVKPGKYELIRQDTKGKWQR
jgi:hypothetical protein